MKTRINFEYKIDVDELYKVDITLDKLFCMEYSDYIKEKSEYCIRQMFDVAEFSSQKVIIKKVLYNQIIEIFIDDDPIDWLSKDRKALQYIEYFVSNKLKNWDGSNMSCMIRDAQRFTLKTCLETLFEYINEIIIKEV